MVNWPEIESCLGLGACVAMVVACVCVYKDIYIYYIRFARWMYVCMYGRGGAAQMGEMQDDKTTNGRFSGQVVSRLSSTHHLGAAGDKQTSRQDG